MTRSPSQLLGGGVGAAAGPPGSTESSDHTSRICEGKGRVCLGSKTCCLQGGNSPSSTKVPRREGAGVEGST